MEKVVNPKVSVIMPSLNVVQYIKECMDSVVNQTLKDIEIICVDAGSTDGTLEILKEYAENDERIRIINSDKKSYGYQMNLGIASANGEYIGIVETDDYILPYMYERLYSFALQKKLEFVKSDFYRFFDNGQRRTEKVAISKNKELYGQILNPSCNPALLDINMINVTGIFQRDFLLRKKILFNETPGAAFQDNGFWFQTFCLGERIAIYPEAFYMVRRDNPNSSVNNPNKIYCMCDEYEYILAFLDKNPNIKNKFIVQFSKKCFSNYLFTLNRVAPEFKYEFLIRFSKDFTRFFQSGYFQEKDFTINDWKFLKQVMTDPYEYYILKYETNEIQSLNDNQNETKIKALEMKLKIANKEIDNIHASVSYRLGRMLTFVPRKIRGGIRCYKEHGIKYTCVRALIHIGLKKNNSKSCICNNKTNNKQLTRVKKDYDYYQQLLPEQYPAELTNWFRSVTGTELNLQNPKTFNEKIQWLKLYDSTDLKAQLADKYLVREWVKKKIGEKYLIPLLGVWNCFDEINFDMLPQQFVLKTNHGSGWNLVVKDKNTLDLVDAKTKFDLWMSKNYAYSAGLELHYSKIKPKIIAEKYMADFDGDIFDYRFFCFSGKPYSVWLDLGSGTVKHKRNIYDLEWNLQPFRVNYPQIIPLPPKPKALKKMISLAETLCGDFPVVRVDFYYVRNQIYFGELTFTPQSGIGKWYPNIYNQKYGDLISLPNKDGFNNE